MLSRLLTAAMALLTGIVLADSATAQNLDAGKTPSQLFSGTCALCHKSPRGLLKSVAPGSLPGFLRQHYTTGTEMASVLSVYVLSNGAADARPGSEPRTRKGKEAKSEPKPKPERKPQEVQRPEAEIPASGAAADVTPDEAKQTPKQKLKKPKQDRRKPPAAAAKDEPKVEPKTEPKAEPKTEQKGESKDKPEIKPDAPAAASTPDASETAKGNASKPEADKPAADQSGADKADTDKSGADKAAKDDAAKSEPAKSDSPKPDGALKNDNDSAKETGKDSAKEPTKEPSKSEAAPTKDGAGRSEGEIRPDPAAAAAPAPKAADAEQKALPSGAGDKPSNNMPVFDLDPSPPASGPAEPPRPPAGSPTAPISE